MTLAAKISVLIFLPIALCFSAQAQGELTLDMSEELVLLSGDSLREAFSGKTHYGTYKEFRERTGTSQYTEYTKADGTTDYQEGNMTTSGIWRVAGDRICYKYYGEISGVHCFIIFKAGTCFYGYNPSNVTPSGPINANYWNAKSIHKGEVSTCDDLLG